MTPKRRSFEMLFQFHLI